MAILKQCQLCGGRIVNDRCEVCGMPYRNDEEMYHLNENRRDHYAHVSESTRQQMRQSEVPMGDRKAAAGNVRAFGETAQSKGTQSYGAGNRQKAKGSKSMLVIFVYLLIMFLMAMLGVMRRL